jgi:transcriptional regulator with XRE-family HTH domain
MIEIGLRLQLLREETGLSQKDFAKVCKVYPSTIQKIEAGKSIGHMATWIAIQRATGCSLDEMVVLR